MTRIRKVIDYSVQRPNRPVVETYGLFSAYTQFSTTSEQCIECICDWYTKHRIDNILVPIITKKAVVSLRLLDWLVTNYAKQHSVRFQSTNGLSAAFHVHGEYGRMRTLWKRRLFDPFRRRRDQSMDLYFTDGHGVHYVTTVAQLNFMYWAITYNVHRYSRIYRDVIEAHMTKTIRQAVNAKIVAKSLGLKYKRTELSRPPSTTCFIYSSPVTIDI